MRKILLFLTITSIFFLCNTTKVYAKTNSFYEGNYINGIYMVRYDRSTNTKHYQKARFYRRIGDGTAAYCLEPFKVFQANNSTYEGILEQNVYDKDTWQRVTDLVAFGYLYKDHIDDKWYAITQMMIWETVDKNNSFYFTDTLNGNKVDIYNEEKSEIERLISDSKRKPSFTNNTYHALAGKQISITDTTGILPNYTTTLDSDSQLINNTFTIKKNNASCYTQKFYSNYGLNRQMALFYNNGSSQQLVSLGASKPLEIAVNFCFHELQLNLTKVDKDTKDFTGQGEASLQDTIFTLYNKKMEKITDITFNKKGKATIIGKGEDSKIDFGTYYLQESKAGIGYQKDDTLYKIVFDENHTNIDMTLENEVIKGKVILEKSYGNKNLMKSEANVVFEVYNKDKKLVDTITTDENGLASIELPYGHYTIKQKTTTEGYSKIKPFEIFIDKIKDYKYKIYDYEEEKPKKEEIIIVDVPNTYLNIPKALVGCSI